MKARNVRAARRQLPPEFNTPQLTEGRSTKGYYGRMVPYTPKTKDAPGGTAKSRSFYWGKKRGRKI